MSSPPDQLLSQPILILDGGLGTTLSQPPYNYNFTSSETPLWSSHLLISDPESLADVHRRFVKEGGADIVLTATYQASYEGFAKTGINDAKAEMLMRSSVDLARRAFHGDRINRDGLVALSLGPYGATTIPSTEYSGDYGAGPKRNFQQTMKEALEDWHERRLNLFTHEDVDLHAFETVPRLDEIEAIRQIMDNVVALQGASARPWWLTCVFPNDAKPDGSYTLPDGSTVQDIVQALFGSRDAWTVSVSKPWGIGLNCTKIWKVRRIVQDFEAAIRYSGHQAPMLVLYPDGAGNEVYDTALQKWVQKEREGDDGTKQKSWDEEMADIVTEVVERGSWAGVVVGGCCKTGFEEICGLSGRLKARESA
jgi:homocysteine S-methyltransferase